MATYPLTWVLASEDGGLKGSLAGQNYESSHLGFPTGNLDWVLMESVIRAGSYTSMSKGQAMVGDSTLHAPCMAGRG